MALKDDDPFSPPDYLSEHLFRSYSPVSYKETKPKPKAAPKPKTVAKQPTNRRIQKEGLYTKAQLTLLLRITRSQHSSIN